LYYAYILVIVNRYSVEEVMILSSMQM